LLLCLSNGFSLGCATTPKPEDGKVYLWPAPPEEPRFVYLRSYTGEADLVKNSFWDTLFGSPPKRSLNNVNSVFASGGRMFAGLPGRRDVAVIDIETKKIFYFSEKGAALKRPGGITGLPDGSRIFVSDMDNKAVFSFDIDGNLKGTIGKKGELQNPVGMAVDGKLGRLYVVDSLGHKVNVYSLAGELLFTFGKPGLGEGEFLYPSNVAVQEGSGKVYIVDTNNFRVQVFDKDGNFLKKFGAVGDGWGSFTRPKGIALDREGNIFVVDVAFDNFQVFDDKFQILFFLGSAGMQPGQFNSPLGIFIDDKDRLFVADSMNSRVQVFQYLTPKWKSEHPEEYSKYLKSAETFTGARERN